VTPVQSASPIINEHEQELQQLRHSVALLTNQCTQLDEANRAWQLYQQTQLDNFRNTIQNYLPIDETSSLDLVAQQIVNQITKEREDFTQRYHTLEQFNNDLQSGNIYPHEEICISFLFYVGSANDLETIKQSSVNTINQLNQELLAMKQQNEQTNRELYY
jgi:exonuclease VII small subunit